jgi:hypothetical protein
VGDRGGVRVEGETVGVVSGEPVGILVVGDSVTGEVVGEVEGEAEGATVVGEEVAGEAVVGEGVMAASTSRTLVTAVHPDVPVLVVCEAWEGTTMAGQKYVSVSTTSAQYWVPTVGVKSAGVYVYAPKSPERLTKSGVVYKGLISIAWEIRRQRLTALVSVPEPVREILRQSPMSCPTR